LIYNACACQRRIGANISENFLLHYCVGNQTLGFFLASSTARFLKSDIRNVLENISNLFRQFMAGIRQNMLQATLVQKKAQLKTFTLHKSQLSITFV